MNRTRVLVADGLTIFRAGVRNLLLRESDLEVIEAADLGEVKDVVADTCPDIALIDLQLPPVGGVRAVEWLHAKCRTHTVVWSFDATHGDVLAAIRAGADGYLHKEISPQGLVRSLRGIIHGEAPLSRDLATLMIDALHRVDEHDRTRERLATLSSREREILYHVADGLQNRQIAALLTISEFTVKRHVQNILAKLECASRRAAADFYRQAKQEYAFSGSSG